MNIKKQPCKKDCAERSATCHAECKKYLEWVEAHKKELAERDKKKQQIDNYCEYARNRNKRLFKMRRYSGNGRVW